MDDYIPVEDVAAILQVTVRQAYRLRDKFPHKKVGTRWLFARAAVEAYAAERGVLEEPRPLPPAKVEVLPAGDLFELVRDQQHFVAELQRQLMQVSHENGRLSAELAHTQAQLTEARQLLEARRRPWWRRLFDLQ